VKAPPPVRRWLLCVDCKSTSTLVADGEVIVMVPLHFVLHLNVLSDDFIRYGAAACDEIPASPEMSAPELPGQSLVFAQQLTGCPPFERLDELGDGEVRRHRHEKMQVVFGNVALDNLNIHGLANLPDRSRTLIVTSPESTGLRYLVIHTT
jgi:hypothetical protein